MDESLIRNASGNRCSLAHCPSLWSQNNDKVQTSFFKFPKDHARCAIWVENCDSKYLPTVDFENLNKKYKLCSLHFEDRMLNFQRNRLLSNAVPTLFKNKPPLITTVKSEVKSENDYETITIDENIPEDKAPIITTVKSEKDYETITIDENTPEDKAQITTTVTSQNTYETITIDDNTPPNIPIDPLTSRPKYYDSFKNQNMFDGPTASIFKSSVSLQTPQYLSAKSPRKLKLKKQLSEEIHLKKQLEKTVIELRSQLEKASSVENCLKLCEMHLPSTMYMLVKNHLLNKNKTPNGQRHLDEITQFAYTVHHLGPKAYHFLQKNFTLPHIRTLRKKNIQCFNKNVQDVQNFQNVQNMVQFDHRYSKI